MLKDCKMMFFKHTKDSKYYSLSDVIGTCPLCTHKKHAENEKRTNLITS